MKRTDWSLYRAFAAVLRQGTLTGAARELGLSQPTLGRRIATLEARLGYALFSRAPEGLVPTPEAEGLRPLIETLECAASAVDQAAAGDGQLEVAAVRLTASEVVAAEVLPGAMHRLGRMLRDFRIVVSVSNSVEDVLRRDADMAVRMTRPQEGELLARKVGDVELGLFAHPSCFLEQTAPTTVADLLEHRLVGFETARPYTSVLTLEGQTLERRHFAFRSDSDTAQLGAIRGGLGIGVCHVPLAGGLQRVLPETFAPRVEMWLAINRDLMRTRRYRELFRALSVELRQHASA